MNYELSNIETLESESIHIIREVAAEFERPVLLFSGGKDSIVMLRLAEKAFWPARIPFPVMHVDTGHNFDEVYEFRDRRVDELGIKLVVASVQEAIDTGRVVEETGPRASRNQLQTVALLDGIESNGFDAAFGGARRDEERARAKERVYSFRDEFGQWDPKSQRPELWSLYNGRHRRGEHIRIFPLSNWTELDIWQYIGAEGIEVPSIYFAHEREVFLRDGMWLAVSPFVTVMEGEVPEVRTVRYRTVGDASCTGAVDSPAVRRRVDHRGDRRLADHRTRCHPRRRPSVRGSDGRPQERGLLLMELLRFATAGSVDDGKSTLIGRLLFDAKSIFEDQLEAVADASARMGLGETNLALLTDGLRAEREQGITIDVAYRYFATPKRKFIIADTPGHIQYTRNMVTGASTADLAVVLIDARKGVIEQSRRHAFIASLLRIPHIVLAVNKMDLVDHSEERFNEIVEEFRAFAMKLDVPDLTFIPISALNGDNVVTRSENMEWYDGSSLLHHLENVHIASDRNLIDARLPVQYVLRPQSNEFHDYRGYAGRIAGGVFKPGDDVVVLPSGFTSKVARIETFDGPVDEAFAPMSVTMLLDDQIDVSRGDMIARPHNQPTSGQDIDAMVCWLTETTKLAPGTKLGIKHTTRFARAMVKELQYRLDVNTLHRDDEPSALSLNEIGRVTLRTTQPLFFDEYRRNRETGSFILIDESTNNTVGAGMILGAPG